MAGTKGSEVGGYERKPVDSYHQCAKPFSNAPILLCPNYRFQLYWCPHPHSLIHMLTHSPASTLTRPGSPELSLLGNERSSRSSCCALSTHLYVLKPNLHTYTHSPLNNLHTHKTHNHSTMKLKENLCWYRCVQIDEHRHEQNNTGNDNNNNNEKKRRTGACGRVCVCVSVSE